LAVAGATDRVNRGEVYIAEVLRQRLDISDLSERTIRLNRIRPWGLAEIIYYGELNTAGF
jgi:hypothetical protein